MSFENTHMVADLIASSKLWIGDGYRAKNSELDSAGIPFARAGDINDGFHFTSGDHLPEEDAWKAGNKLSEAGDVVFTSKGTVGRFGFVTEEIQRFVYSPQLCFWRSLDCEAIYPRFLFYWIQGKEFYRQYKSVSQKTDMAEYVSLSDQRSMEITLPELSSQQAIAHILGTLDDKIELNRKTNETLEAMAKALFKSWFVDFDPVRAKAEGRPTGLPAEVSDLFPDSFEDSELGEIPSGWEVKALDEIAHFLNGLALQKFPPEDGAATLPVIKIAQLKKGDSTGADRCSTAVPSDYVVRDGDMLFSWSGSLAVDIWCGGDGALNQHLFKVTSKTYGKWFFYQWVNHHLPDFQEIAQGKATTMGHIQRHHLSEAKVLIPPPSLLAAMDSTFTALLDRAFGSRRQSKDLASIRDALLPKLISGEIRIPDAEKMLEEVGV
jgi:type I restriction enzyme, S subunit